MANRGFDHADIEAKARKKWAALNLYETDLQDSVKEPYYLLVEFPYPSGDLHIGHWYAFAVTDIYARMLRARGKNVLFPIGFDAFGLPAENAAIKHGVDPKEWTYKNIERMRTQLMSMGASFDWSKEVIACDPDYYQWTQWLFTKFFEQGLVERREAPVKWCPKDQTVLANEQVIAGHCERCGTEVVEKNLTQWFMKITQYAERLLEGLEQLPWREEIKEAQRAWIGKSEGAKLSFALVPEPEPTFYQFSEPGKIKEGAPFVERDTILAIVKHWKEDKYLGLKWKKVDWETWVTGGVEKGQTPEEAARAEVLQETGYKNLRRVLHLGKMHSKFYHVPKKQNRFGHFDLFYFELEDDEREALADEELAIHEVVWLGKEDIPSFGLPASHRYAWDVLQAGGAQPEERVTVFTTRPDTLFGATYLVLAPEHPLVARFIHQAENAAEIQAYLDATARKTERERSENKEKTGVELKGVTAVNPATDEPIPVYVADYVLSTYGTGAVMAVPAHDERDFAFAQRFKLPIVQVVAPHVIDEGNPPQSGKPTVERTTILAIVHNPKGNTYLALKWKKQRWTTFITGGVDDGENAVEAAKREIREETGYTDVRLVRPLGDTVSEFFAAHKDENRIAHNSSFLFELASDAREPIAKAEVAQHEAVWLPLEEIRAEKMRHAEVSYLVDRLESGDTPHTGGGTLVRSGSFSGMENTDAMWEIVRAVKGERSVNYRLRDWLVSRQRYWGCPIPVVYDPQGTPHAIPAEHLPWELPTDVDFAPTGEAPLASSQELRDRVTKIFGEGWTPEIDTLDTFVDSSWYFLRYLDPKDTERFSSEKLMKKWMPVDRYSGGSEHTTMHVLYARFFMKALYDLALVPVDEPFNERFNRGLIMGPDGQKMSKSKGNVVNPDEFVAQFGADAVRIYLAFIGPYNEPGSYPWQLDGVASMRKFLERVTRRIESAIDGAASENDRRHLARTAKRVAEEGDRFKFNTGVAALMELLNALEASSNSPQSVMRDFVVLLAPFAPHLCEALWEQLGETGSVHAAPWPSYDPALLESSEATVVVQVNGKRRGEVRLAAETPEAEVLAAAQADSAIASHFVGRTIARTVYVPGKILNIVVTNGS